MRMKLEYSDIQSDRGHEKLSVEASKQTTVTIDEVLLWDAT